MDLGFDTSSLEGTIIAQKYRLQKRLAGGGMGDVYLAEHIHLKEPRAIKLVRKELLGDPLLQKRFLREIEVTHKLSRLDDRIVSIYDDFGFEDRIGYYVMEYLEGDLLSERILQNKATLDIKWCIHIVREIASAMELVHQKGVVHRDLKPDNIFLTEYRGQPDFIKIVDFGIAKQQNEQDPRLTRQGVITGTPYYMSPEQITGPMAKKSHFDQDFLDGRSDIYSLGSIFYEMLAGQAPFFRGNMVSPLEQSMLLVAQATEIPPDIRDFRPEVSDELFDVLSKSLEKKPQARFQSMASFADALSEITLQEKTQLSPSPLFQNQHNQIPITKTSAYQNAPQVQSSGSFSQASSNHSLDAQPSNLPTDSHIAESQDSVPYHKSSIDNEDIKTDEQIYKEPHTQSKSKMWLFGGILLLLAGGLALGLYLQNQNNLDPASDGPKNTIQTGHTPGKTKPRNKAIAQTKRSHKVSVRMPLEKREAQEERPLQPPDRKAKEAPKNLQTPKPKRQKRVKARRKNIKARLKVKQYWTLRLYPPNIFQKYLVRLKPHYQRKANSFRIPENQNKVTISIEALRSRYRYWPCRFTVTKSAHKTIRISQLLSKDEPRLNSSKSYCKK